MDDVTKRRQQQAREKEQKRLRDLGVKEKDREKARRAQERAQKAERDRLNKKKGGW